jgi:MFS transporter, PPP family, 3-phenylpropionic acid transporter
VPSHNPSILRPAIVYAIFFSAVGAIVPYMAVFYRSIGLGVEVVGLLAALWAAAGLVAAPAWGMVADRVGTVRYPLVLAGAWAALAGLGLGVLREPLLVPPFVVAISAALAGIVPMLDARTVEMVGANRDRFGRARAWGSAAFVVAALFVGLLVDRLGPAALFLVAVPALGLTSVAAGGLLTGGRGRSRMVRPTSSGITALLRQRQIALFLGGSIVVWTTVSAFSTFLSLHLVSLGASAQLVGVVWALGAAIEVPIMFAFPAIARRIPAERLIVAAALVFAVRTIGFALTTDLTMLFAIAVVGGPGFALFYVGTVTYVARTTPAHLQTTAQGIFTGTSASIGAILGAILGGSLGSVLTLRGMFATVAIGTIVGAAIVARAIVPARRQVAAPASEALAAGS